MAKRLSYKKQIAKILNDFDFKRVHRCMTAMNWTWHEKSVPSIEQLQECARELLRDCKRKRGHALSTGGFQASCDGSHLSLTFLIEEANGYEAQ